MKPLAKRHEAISMLRKILASAVEHEEARAIAGHEKPARAASAKAALASCEPDSDVDEEPPAVTSPETGAPKTPRCPSCSSSAVLPIFYGEPPADVGAAAARGELVIGGCLLTDNDPAWACRDCGARVGKREEGRKPRRGGRS